MVSEEHKIPKNYFKFHYKVLKVFGIAIENFESNLVNIIYKIYAVIIIVPFFYLYAIAEIIDLIQNWENLESSTFTMSYLTSHILGICKLSLVLIFRKDIHKYCKALEEGIFKPDFERGGPKEFDLVFEAITACNRQGYFFHLFVILIVGQRTLYALFDEGKTEVFFDEELNQNVTKLIRTLPCSCWLPFEVIDSPFYELGASYQVISSSFFGFIIGAIDALICGILCHIKAQFLILSNSLSCYTQRAVSLMEKDGLRYERNGSGKFPKLLQKYLRISIADCVKHHQEIIELADGAETTFNYLMLVQFLGSLLLICLQLFQLSLYELDSFRFFSMICYLVLMMYQVLVYCWYGNEVMLVSQQIVDAAFNSDWIDIDVSLQKSLVLMMTRAYRPIRMTAGKFVFLSLQTFMSIIRGSGSYFMVLRNMNINRNLK